LISNCHRQTKENEERQQRCAVLRDRLEAELKKEMLQLMFQVTTNWKC